MTLQTENCIMHPCAPSVLHHSTIFMHMIQRFFFVKYYTKEIKLQYYMIIPFESHAIALQANFKVSCYYD